MSVSDVKHRSKTVDRAEYDAVSAKCHLYELALYLEHVETPAAVERFSIDDYRFTARLFRATSAHGGIVITSSQPATRTTTEAQCKTVEADYLEHATNYYRDLLDSGLFRYVHARDAYAKLTTTRNYLASL